MSDEEIAKLDEAAAERIKSDCMDGDNEIDHSMADGVLCDLLKSLGCNKVVDAWEAVGKWYA